MANKSMTSIRMNFMLALSAWLSSQGLDPRPVNIERRQLVAFEATWSEGQVGPTGQPLHSPSWLTTEEQYRVSRGIYRLPWDALDAHQAVLAGTVAAPAESPAVSGSIASAVDAAVANSSSAAPVESA